MPTKPFRAHLEHIYNSMGVKCHIGNKNNLLCVNAFIYVMNDVDNGHNMEKTSITFLWFGNILCHIV